MLKQYLGTFVIILISFMAMFIVIDIFDRLPRLLKYESDYWLLVQYFVLRVPYLSILVSPVIVLLSGLFLMNTLSKYHESIAMRAAGISIRRMVSPLLIVGILMSIIIALLGEFALPPIETYRNKIYTVDIKKQQLEDVKLRSNIYYSGSEDYLYYIGFFDGYQNIMRTIDITKFDGKNGSISRKITANDAVWNGEAWIFSSCYDREFSADKMTKYSYSARREIKEIKANPNDFIKVAKSNYAMNYFELKEYIKSLKKIGEKYHSELVDLYTKISFPLANFIILLFCVPLASTSVRSKGRGIVFLFGVIICFAYLTTLRICQSLGYNEILDPVWAAWLPNLIFFTFGFFFLVKSEV
ncbi:MAG TPA: LptF/LptG family permease [Candidatus Cloacimonadota bacterium]|nr:LptF/LptG family permease [Candidatus Cloacimonadota bacterium]